MKKANPEFIFLIWEEVPENTYWYAIPLSHVSKDEIDMLEACHNNWINSGEVDERRGDAAMVDRSLNCIMNMILDPSEDWIDRRYRDEHKDYCGMELDQFNAILGKWHGFKLDAGEPIYLASCRVYRTGFLV